MVNNPSEVERTHDIILSVRKNLESAAIKARKKSAATIQSIYRHYIEKKEAAIAIQSIYRQHYIEKQSAAITIQSIYRQHYIEKQKTIEKINKELTRLMPKKAKAKKKSKKKSHINKKSQLLI